MQVNEQAEGLAPLRERIRELETIVRSFVHPSRGYSSGVATDGSRWCAPRVTVEEMDAAREAVNAR